MVLLKTGLEEIAWERYLSGKRFFEMKKSSKIFNFLFMIHQVNLAFPKYQSWQNLVRWSPFTLTCILKTYPRKPANCLHEADGGVCVLRHLLEPSSWSLWATLDLPISLVCPPPSHSVSWLMLPSLKWGTLFSDEIFDLQAFFPPWKPLLTKHPIFWGHPSIAVRIFCQN